MFPLKQSQEQDYFADYSTAVKNFTISQTTRTLILLPKERMSKTVHRSLMTKSIIVRYLALR